MGLAIVVKIIEAHGGRCWIESVEGEGTTIFFTLAKSVRRTGALSYPRMLSHTGRLASPESVAVLPQRAIGA
jgi:hypothetical protein